MGNRVDPDHATFCLHRLSFILCYICTLCYLEVHSNKNNASYLTLTMLWANSEDNKFMINDDNFLYFSQKIGFAISYKCSPKESIYMKYQSLFLGGKK